MALSPELEKQKQELIAILRNEADKCRAILATPGTLSNMSEQELKDLIFNNEKIGAALAKIKSELDKK